MSGFARANINVSDSSIQANNTNAGLIAVIGMTEHGDLNKPIIVSNPLEYQRKFGNLLPVTVSLFPLYCMRALQAGAKLLICSIARASTGTKATCSLSGGALVATSKNAGDYANSISIKISTAISRTANLVDILISNTDGTISQVFRDVSNTQTTNSIAILNATSSFVVFDSGVTAFSVGTYSFTGGIAPSAPIASDYIGDAVAKTGIYAFDSYSGFTDICAMDIADNNVDNAIVNYCTMRGDCYAILRTPLATTTGDSVLAYCNAVSPYPGSAVNAIGVVMTTGYSSINHPTITGATINISEVDNYVAATSIKNAKDFAWVSVANPKYSLITNVNGVVVNYAAAGLSSDADAIVNAGITPIVQLQNGEVRIFGNDTLYSGKGLLKKRHIADLVMFLRKKFQGFANAQLFTPNDIETWRTLNRLMSAVLENAKTNRGLYEYAYYGDQDVSKIEDVRVNTVSGIAAGNYTAIIEIFPINTLERITINLNVVGSSITTSVK